MTRYVVHKSDCPALCQMNWVSNPERGFCSHDEHLCSGSCPSPEALAELVEAADDALVSLRGYDQDNAPNLPQADEVTRLNAALKPFTKENQ